MARRGRKSQINDNLIEAAFELISRGYTDRDTYAHPDVGISHSTWYNWLNQGEELANSEEPYEDMRERHQLLVDFYEAIEAANAMRKNKLQEAWHKKALTDDWRAAKAWLEAQHPEEWSVRRKLDLTSDDERIEFVIEYADTSEGEGDD